MNNHVKDTVSCGRTVIGRDAHVPARRRRGCPLGDGGFTLVELLTVAAIIGMLLLLGISGYNRFIEAVKLSRASSEIRGLEKDVYAYIVDKNALPNSLNGIGRGGLRDPWGNPYQYLNIANGGAPRKDQFLNQLNEDFDLYSKGADGDTLPKISESVSLDDVVRTGNGGWVGLAESF